MGYREGLFAGKSQAMQPGFDAGFALHSRLAILVDIAKMIQERVKKENMALAARLALAIKAVKEDTAAYSSEELAVISGYFDNLIQMTARVVENKAAQESDFPAAMDELQESHPKLFDFYAVLGESIRLLLLAESSAPEIS